jgi:hypothetical protein
MWRLERSRWRRSSAARLARSRRTHRARRSFVNSQSGMSLRE